FSFDFTFDGTDISLDAGSTDPVGISLVADDTFELDLHAAPGDFWRVESAYSQSFPMSFIVNPAGSRNGDSVASFLRGGVEVFEIAELGVSQLEVHIGAQNWTLPVGLEFDTVLLSYMLNSAVALPPDTENIATTIIDRPDVFGSISNPERPFFRNSSLVYETIPEPTGLLMGMVSLLFATGRTRR
ncbi:unnamed protein product, partial [Ectocarpus sp. 4 AP-2014]